MKLFIRNLTIFLLIQLFVWAGVLWVYLRNRPFGKEYIAAGIDKYRLLEQQTSPRLLLVGGSNVAFGFDSAEINSRLKYNPVNMGLYVGLGLDFMLAEVEPSLRANDVVVVSLEYDLFNEHFYYGVADGLFLSLEERPEIIRFLSLGNGRVMLKNGYDWAGKILQATVSYLRGENDPMNNPNALYKRNSFNQYGDLVAHRNQPLRKPRVGLIAPETTSSTVLRAINRLNRFSEACERKGVKIFYLYPSIPEPYYRQHKEPIDEVAALIRQELKIQTLNTPEEMSLPIEDFFDTGYHVNSSGITKRTRQLIERLSEKLNVPQ
jgi:hypothetical protein